MKRVDAVLNQVCGLTINHHKPLTIMMSTLRTC
ncbi:hypothetical protein T12_9754 [Trichinella patagoniensis]|uniref:Uncharacterized protein n=1 Tax=Trichinella patagoniensis TaxID=990121 RepID=A0A0V0YQ38_9BILA|nr:hypothetical protein T12_9754 [Trichinella patagoniensis]